jgi:hypothetical protein
MRIERLWEIGDIVRLLEASQISPSDVGENRKAAWFLIGFAGFALWCATPATAENDQVQFYNSPEASAVHLFIVQISSE